jgi:hypothetical protein
MHLNLPLFQIFSAFIACAPAEFLKKFVISTVQAWLSILKELQVAGYKFFPQLLTKIQ